MENTKRLLKELLLITYIAFVYIAFNYSILGSETLVLTTYYPAPYGGYARLLTTDMTLLARDSGNVGIGTNNPQKKLDVQGGSMRVLSGRIGSAGFDPDSGYPSGWWGGVHTWDVYAEASIMAGFQFCLGGGVGGRSTNDCITSFPSCTAIWYNGSGRLTYCPSGYYVVGFRPGWCSATFYTYYFQRPTGGFDLGSIGACGTLICCRGLKLWW